MTVNTTTSRVSYAGNGTTTAFSVPFYFLAAADLVVIRTSSTGTQTTLVLNTDYTVSGAGVPAGGTVTCTTAPAATDSLVIYRDPAATQLTDYQANDPFPAETHERALDKLTMLAQRMRDLVSRSFRLSDGDTTTASTTLPSPSSNKLIGWNASATGLQNVDQTTLATIVAFGTSNADVFTGNGTQTAFTLTANPANQANLDVSVGGVTQLPGVDYNWVSGTTVTFTTAPPNGAKVLIRYFQALPQGSTDSAASTFVQSGTGAVTRTAQSKMREVVSATDFGAVVDGVTNNTAAVQSAINALGVYGGTVFIPDGVRFNLQALTFPARLTMSYRADDDTSSPGQGSDIGSSERVLFLANSSYPASPSGGIVNEYRVTAPFAPAYVLDVRKDITAEDPYLGPGQSRTDPVRASFNILEEQSVQRFYMVYMNYAAWSNFSGMYLENYRATVTLNGIGTAQWVSVPTENTVITGATSGAKGLLLSVSAGATTVLWQSGRFVAGERLIDNNETTTATVSSVSFSNISMQWLAQDFKRGNWSIGLPPGVTTHLFAVGGKIAATKSRSASQYIDVTVTNPAYVWVDDYEAGTPNGFEITYNVAPAAASRRLTLRKLNQTADMGHVGAVAAHASCTDGGGSPALRAGSFNLASIARGGTTGRYDFTFSNALPTANFRILASAQFNGFITWDLKATTGFSVFVTNASGVAQWAPFDFEVVVIGGDI